MKFKRLAKATGLALGVLMAVSLACCTPKTQTPPDEGIVDDYDPSTRTAMDENEIKYVAPEMDTYFNYIELFDDKGKVYYIGDPFVMRYNGKYYLYTSCTTGHLSHGIPCWVSDNMIDWTFSRWAYGNGTEGSGGDLTFTAYAPEIVFYRGYFYMCEAPNGQGHRILRSENPDGPFELVSDNLGEGIDGSFWVDSNDNLYLLAAVPGFAAQGTIFAIPLTVGADGRVTKGQRKAVDTAELGSWTEGPEQFERDGYKYFTYTGNHVNSADYRMGYSYTTNASLFAGLKTVDNKIFLISTGDDLPYEGGGYGSTAAYETISTYRGTGHSSNVYGPNLDSVFVAYHTANRKDHTGASAGSSRRYNITQMFTNQSYLTVNGLCTYDTPKPAMPTFTANGAEDLSLSGGYYLTEKSTEAVFTAELNLTLQNGKGSVVVGYDSNGNYTEVSIDGTSLTVNKVSGGAKTQLASATIAESNFDGALHTVKVVNGYGKSEIWYDHVNRARLTSSVAGAGKIGVVSGVTIGCVQFTNDAFGTGDFETPKNLTATFPAYAYLKTENRGYSISSAEARTDGVRQGEKESTKQVEGAVATVLGAGDWVKYAVNAPAASRYALNIDVSKASKDCIFEVIVDEANIFKMSVNDVVFPEEGDGYVTAHTGAFTINTPGIHSIKIRVYKGTLDMTNISTQQKATRLDDFENALTESFEQGTLIIGTPTFSSNYGLVTPTSDDRFLYYFGAKGLANYEYSVDVTVKNGTKGAGLLFRTKNFNWNGGDLNTEPHSFQGYYLQITSSNVTLYKYNYSEKRLAQDSPLVDGVRAFASGRTNRVTVRAVQNKFVILLNDEQILEVTDATPFMDGYCGLYSESSQIFFKNLSFKKL